jgi:hypothetical protein
LKLGVSGRKEKQSKAVFGGYAGSNKQNKLISSTRLSKIVQ